MTQLCLEIAAYAARLTRNSSSQKASCFQFWNQPNLVQQKNKVLVFAVVSQMFLQMEAPCTLWISSI